MTNIENNVRKAASAVDAGKQKLATAMEQGSEKLLNGAVMLEEGATSAASKLSDGANYLRTKSNGDMVRECSTVVEKYPYHSMLLAVVAGVFLGRSIWKRQDSYLART